MVNENVIKEIKELSHTLPHPQGALLQALFIVQKQQGYLTSDSLKTVAEILELPPVHVKGVATFYSLYTDKPLGRNVIKMCTSISCMLCGCEKLVSYLHEKYNLKPGETTKDGRFTLKIIDCISSCASGPSMFINDNLYDNLTEKKLDQILASYT